MNRRKLLTLFGGGISLAGGIFRDVFQSTLAAGSVNGSQAQPGPGVRTVADIENTIKLSGGALRGCGQPTSAAWGESRLVYPSQTRKQGRALVALVVPQDYFGSNWWLAWANSATPTTPNTAGFGLYQSTAGIVNITTTAAMHAFSGASVTLQPEQLLIAIVQQSTGYVLLLSAAGEYTNLSGLGTDAASVFGNIAKFPEASIWYIDRVDTTDPLYPVISWYNSTVAYPNGFYLDEVRIIDIPDAVWNVIDGFGLAKDTFTAADTTTLATHAADIGGAWSMVGNAVWTITGNKVYLTSVSPANEGIAYIPQTATEYIVQVKLTTPVATRSAIAGVILKYQDANNYIYAGYLSNQCVLRRIVAGSGTSIVATGYSWTDGVTYDLKCYVKGNYFRIVRDNQEVITATLDTNFGANYAAGLIAYKNDNQFGFDDFTVYPRRLTLPALLQVGSVPTVMTGGATISSDAFTGGAGTVLSAHSPDVGPAWDTAIVGTWKLDGAGKVGINPTGTYGKIQLDTGVTSFEASVDITFPADVSHITAGFIAYTASDNYFTAWLIRDDTTQATFHEIELRHVFTGYSDVAHKAGLGLFIAANESHTLKLQVTPNIIHVFVDGNFVNSYIPPVAIGSKIGLVLDNYNGYDTGCLFDNWIVKAL
ncbi:hypothetical protein CCP3SC15_1540006 [Gammaproteobacteria bacterium]